MEGRQVTVTTFSGDMEFSHAHEVSVICCDYGDNNINMEWVARDGWRDAEVSL